jgi:hypothetical protein
LRVDPLELPHNGEATFLSISCNLCLVRL